MRRNLYTLGMTAYVAALALPVVLMIVEIQYWTRDAFVTTSSADTFGDTTQKISGGYADPGLTLNFSGTTAAWLTIFAIIATLAACLLLMSRQRLVAIAAMWIAMGACLNGHLYHRLGHGWWIALAAAAVVAAFAPPLGIFRRLYPEQEMLDTRRAPAAAER